MFAGGESRRFGSDKALALLDGQCLIDHVIARLAPQVDMVVICGRDWPPFVMIADRPAPGLGPLGALCGALEYAAAQGYDAVLTCGCDMPRLPFDLASRLAGDRPAVALGQPMLGLWQASLLPALDAHLATGNDRRMSTWVARASAVAVDFGPIANINTAAELAALGVNPP